MPNRKGYLETGIYPNAVGKKGVKAGPLVPHVESNLSLLDGIASASCFSIQMLAAFDRSQELIDWQSFNVKQWFNGLLFDLGTTLSEYDMFYIFMMILRDGDKNNIRLLKLVLIGILQYNIRDLDDFLNRTKYQLYN